ncbi:putative transposase-like protein [Abeliophyllum distichum]|uniref:Transposase-like protein n=1 Tax=Abeliophyllum distichum TaxID=126358 RepID=A0ABD1PRF0_9LAMI
MRFSATVAASPPAPVITTSRRRKSSPPVTVENDIDHHMSQLELFSHVHMTNHGLGNFIDIKSKIVHDKYKASIEFKYGIDGDDQPEFDPDSWINAVNGPSKGRIYGFGPRQHVAHVLGTPASPRCSILAHDIMSNGDVNKLKSELSSARNTIEENNERIDNLTVRLERF